MITRASLFNAAGTLSEPTAKHLKVGEQIQ
jgi:hypothetical protein